MAGNTTNIDMGALLKQIVASRSHAMAAHGQSIDTMKPLLYGNDGSSNCSHGVALLQQVCQLQDGATGFNAHLINFITLVLFPISGMLSWVIMTIGVILIATAIYRIREHSVGSAARQKSFMSTAFYFVSGAVLLQYGPLLHMVSASTFYGFYDSNGYVGNVLQYANIMKTETSTSMLMQQFTFSLLLIVGLFSFTRGIFLLIKLGEGNGQESAVSKCMAHIVAGMIGVNASAAWHLMSYITSVLGS